MVDHFVAFCDLIVDEKLGVRDGGARAEDMVLDPLDAVDPLRSQRGVAHEVRRDELVKDGKVAAVPGFVSDAAWNGLVLLDGHRGSSLAGRDDTTRKMFAHRIRGSPQTTDI
jgi:hypothetical protein